MLVAVAVGGRRVAVTVGRGMEVVVAVGDGGGVWVAVSVGSGVSVGNGVANGNVGKGVNVGKSKLNSGVGVTSVPAVGKTFGLGTAVEGARRENTLIGIAQRQQDTSRKAKTKNILPVCPCWL